jgi:ankyrin repeat protein
MNEFLTAVRHCNLSRVRGIVEENGDAILLTKCDQGLTAMHLATGNGHLEMVQYLCSIDNSCMDVQCQDGNTPLHFACHLGCTEISEFLVNNGADVHLRNAKGETALYVALDDGSDYKMAHYLLEEGGATVDIGNGLNAMLLHLAIGRPNQAVVRYLLEHESPVATWRRSALFTAIHESAEMVKFLVQQNLVNVEDVDGWGHTALHQAVVGYPDISIVKFLVQETSCNIEGYAECVQVLLEDGGADVEARDRNGRTALHHGAENGRQSVSECLVNYGKANVEAIDDALGQTPLHLACIHSSETLSSRFATVKILVEGGGANVEAIDKMGRTALHWACRENHLKIVQYLVEEHGVNAVTADREGWTALHFACGAGYLGLAVYLVAHIRTDD